LSLTTVQIRTYRQTAKCAKQSQSAGCRAKQTQPVLPDSGAHSPPYEEPGT